ncbi:toxin-antitoxin system YwqK family antitoxin [Saccharothrix sp. Mg75]|uniref:toxin-antitoxin system YwqK family antitoxin n=1 Tax=Saccharothrix sp. Mg75 TaxID=3445357 RepID=UPI003EEF9920
MTIVRVDESDTYVDDAQRVCHDDGPFTGEVEHRDGNGRLVGSNSYFEGISSGLQEEYHPDGRLRSRGWTHMGVAVGDWYEWYPDGRSAAHHVFSDSGRPEQVERWDERGAPVGDGG